MENLDLNPLTVLNARRIKFLAPHLETIELTVTEYHYYENIVIDWIQTNLKGRYFYGTITKIVDNRIVTRKVVAFEDQYETSMFLLKCPYVGQK